MQYMSGRHRVDVLVILQLSLILEKRTLLVNKKSLWVLCAFP